MKTDTLRKQMVTRPALMDKYKNVIKYNKQRLYVIVITQETTTTAFNSLRKSSLKFKYRYFAKGKYAKFTFLL